MSQFFDDMVEILDPYIGENLGSSRDQWNYGNYAEFPNSRTITDDQIEQLLAYFNIYLPFDEEFSFEETLREHLKTYGVSEEMLELLDYPTSSFTFPSIDDPDIKDSVVECLIDAGAPIGETLYEDAGELPEKYMYYWDGSDDFLDQYSIEFVNYKREVESIKEKVESSRDTLVKKSLILAAFVYTESFVRSKIVSILPDLTRFDDLVTKNILEKYFNDKLEKTDGRKVLYKQYFGNRQDNEEMKKLPDIPHVKLRNILAHDISASEVEGSEIVY